MKKTIKHSRVPELIHIHSNWREILEKRQHKFVLSFIQEDYDMSKVALTFGYSTDDMHSIFERIEKKLVAYDLYLNELRQKKQYDSFFNSLEEPNKELFKILFEKAEKINIYEVFPPKLAQYIQNIQETKDLDKSAAQMGVGKSYLVQRIKGRNKPRKPCERGALFYLENHYTKSS